MTDAEDFAVILGMVKTAPLERSEVARWFGVSPRRISETLAAIPGVVEVGRRVRIPLVEMPPEYFVDIGLLKPAKLGQTRTGKKEFDTTGD